MQILCLQKLVLKFVYFFFPLLLVEALLSLLTYYDFIYFLNYYSVFNVLLIGCNYCSKFKLWLFGNRRRSDFLFLVKNGLLMFTALNWYFVVILGDFFLSKLLMIEILKMIFVDFDLWFWIWFWISLSKNLIHFRPFLFMVTKWNRLGRLLQLILLFLLLNMALFMFYLILLIF